MKLVSYGNIVHQAETHPNEYLYQRMKDCARSDIYDRIEGGLCDNYWFDEHNIDAFDVEVRGDGLSDDTLIEFFDDIGYIMFDENGNLWERWN